VTIEPGTLLGDRYRVVRVLGRGGMGLVAEARNVITDKRVAVKWLHAEAASDPELSLRLVREATAASRIRHPNVVDVYDVIRDGAAIILVMELLEGEPMRALLDRRPSISALLAALLPAMRGVCEAHQQGVIHRDIHPGNIFLARESDGVVTPKVLDFGISKIGSEAAKQAPTLTRSGITMGTPLYMSYEQLISARDVDTRTDVYSFGVVLYEGLTGQVPYDGENFAAIAMQIVNGQPVPPRELRPDLAPELERIVLRAMARNREDRIARLDELARALAPFAAGGEVPMPVMARSDRPPAPRAAQETVDLGGRHVDTQGRISSPLAQSAPPRHRGDPARPQKRALLWGMGAGAGAALIGAAIVLHGAKPSPPAATKPAAVVVPAQPTVPSPVLPPVLPPVARVEPVQAPDAGVLVTPPMAAPPARPPVRVPAGPVVAPVVKTPDAQFRAGRARREDF
jgi:eukaryotic-like serine/threonine-protein kinase